MPTTITAAASDSFLFRNFMTNLLRFRSKLLETRVVVRIDSAQIFFESIRHGLVLLRVLAFAGFDGGLEVVMVPFQKKELLRAHLFLDPGRVAFHLLLNVNA